MALSYGKAVRKPSHTGDKVRVPSSYTGRVPAPPPSRVWVDGCWVCLSALNPCLLATSPSALKSLRSQCCAMGNTFNTNGASVFPPSKNSLLTSLSCDFTSAYCELIVAGSTERELAVNLWGLFKREVKVFGAKGCFPYSVHVRLFCCCC